MLVKKIAMMALAGLMLTGCSLENKVCTDLLHTSSASGAFAQIARKEADRNVIVPLFDTGHYKSGTEEIVYSVSFKQDVKASDFSFEGVSGISVSGVRYEDEHTVYLAFAGDNNEAGVKRGYITFNGSACSKVEQEYQGFTFRVSLFVGDTNERAVYPN